MIPRSNSVWLFSILLFSSHSESHHQEECQRIVMIAFDVPAKASDMCLKTADSKEQCVTELKMCELDPKNLNIAGMPGERGDKGPIGEKGPQGEQGLKGDKGSIGEKGSKGDPGLNGEKGSTGEIGSKGEPGLNGDKGSPGEKGEKGDNGPRGEEGARGEKGERGPMGPKGELGSKGDTGRTGPKGAPGMPGMPGTCGCAPDEFPRESKTKEIKPKKEVEDQWGTDINPGEICRKAPPGTKSNQDYILQLDITAVCDMETHRTCIRYDSEREKDEPPIIKTFHHEKMPFWLSEQYLTPQDIYNLNIEQLLYLQSKSFSANLTIKYHCFNSIPVGKGKPLMLLSWNDILVGPDVTESSPFNYHVDPETDGCSKPENQDKWNYTIIKLVSPMVQRLPIVDFFINDIRDDLKQELKIEILELCFG